MKYYSREILEQYLKDTRLNKILNIIDETEPYLTEDKTVPANINVCFCRECINRGYMICPQFNIAPNGDIVDWTEEDGFCNLGEKE